MSSAWGVWSSPALSGADYTVRNEILPYNAALKMDLLEADQRIKEAGYAGSYSGVNLRWPNPIGILEPQPYYIFDMESSGPGSPRTVAVGIYNGHVQATQNLQQDQSLRDVE